MPVRIRLIHSPPNHHTGHLLQSVVAYKQSVIAWLRPLILPQNKQLPDHGRYQLLIFFALSGLWTFFHLLWNLFQRVSQGKRRALICIVGAVVRSIRQHITQCWVVIGAIGLGVHMAWFFSTWLRTTISSLAEQVEHVPRHNQNSNCLSQTSHHGHK